MIIHLLPFIFAGLPAGVGTFPTLQGLPRDHRAVPSLALDETMQLSSMVA
jgi:hypothetical protein